MRSTVFVAALALALALAAPAGAATVRTLDDNFWFSDIYFEAAPGETNTVTVSYARDITWTVLQALPFPFETFPGSTTVRDTSAPLTALSICNQVDAHTVSCPPGAVHISLGDGQDRAQINTVANATQAAPFNGFEAVVLGGTGADRLISDEASSFLAGEDGDDHLEGAPTHLDGFAGGAGDDDIVSLDLSAEDVFCGPGDDAVLPDATDRRATSCERIGLG
jgi:hypothetical protein